MSHYQNNNDNHMMYNQKRYAEVNHRKNDKHKNRKNEMFAYHDNNPDNANYLDRKPAERSRPTIKTTNVTNHNRDSYREDNANKKKYRNQTHSDAAHYHMNDEHKSCNKTMSPFHNDDADNAQNMDRKPAARSRSTIKTNVTNQNRDS